MRSAAVRRVVGTVGTSSPLYGIRAVFRNIREVRWTIDREGRGAAIAVRPTSRLIRALHQLRCPHGRGPTQPRRRHPHPPPRQYYQENETDTSVDYVEFGKLLYDIRPCYLPRANAKARSYLYAQAAPARAPASSAAASAAPHRPTPTHRGPTPTQPRRRSRSRASSPTSTSSRTAPYSPIPRAARAPRR